MKTLAELLSTILFKRHALIALLLLCACPLFGKRKDDVVVMTNGDTFTGEIKSLQYGELIFNSGYMRDSVHLDWNKVKTLQSKDIFIVSLANGTRVTGVIDKEAASTEGAKDFEIVGEGPAVEVATSEVIGIGQQEASFWNQLTGSINYGFGFASGNQETNSVFRCGRRIPHAQELYRIGDVVAVWFTDECQEHESLHLRFAVWQVANEKMACRLDFSHC